MEEMEALLRLTTIRQSTHLYEYEEVKPKTPSELTTTYHFFSGIATYFIRYRLVLTSCNIVFVELGGTK
jgi:hypothetical protein